MLNIATITTIETKKILNLKNIGFIYEWMTVLILIIFVTNNPWAISSKRIKANTRKRLNILYIDKSNFIPRKIECNIRNIAEQIPKNLKYLA